MLTNHSLNCFDSVLLSRLVHEYMGEHSPILVLVGNLGFIIKLTNFIIMHNDCAVLMATKELPTLFFVSPWFEQIYGVIKALSYQLYFDTTLGRIRVLEPA